MKVLSHLIRLITAVQAKGLSLEEIDELYGDPVAVHLSAAATVDEEEFEKHIDELNTQEANGKPKGSTMHEESIGLEDRKIS